MTGTININKEVFQLKFDEFHNPMVEFHGAVFQSLQELVSKAPVLSDQKNLLPFVKIANFLFRGDEFDVIANIPEFQKRYATVTKKVPQYGTYDISVVKNPEVKNGQLIFFAEHSTMHVPYQITCPFPFIGDDAEYRYGLLITDLDYDGRKSA